MASVDTTGPVFTETRYGRPGVAIPEGMDPAGKGEPVMAVSAPAFTPDAVIAYDDTSPPPFPTYTNCPFGSTVIPFGVVPAANGEPAMGVNTPVPAVIV